MDGKRRPPSFKIVNGHKIFDVDGTFKIVTDEGQVGPDFDNFPEAARHATGLPAGRD